MAGPFCLIIISHPKLLYWQGYISYLSLMGFLLHSHADSCLPPPTPVDQNAPECAALSPGDRILLKQLVPRSLEPWWTGPHMVILTTPLSAKLLGHPCWYHLSRLKQAPAKDTCSVWQLEPSTLWFSKMPKLGPICSSSWHTHLCWYKQDG